MKVCVVGVGYVGLVTAACLAVRQMPPIGMGSIHLDGSAVEQPATPLRIMDNVVETVAVKVEDSVFVERPGKTVR